MKKSLSLTLLLAIVTLTACDKLKGVEKPAQPAPQTQVPTAQPQSLTDALQHQSQSGTQDLMLALFNQSVKVTAMARNIVTDAEKNEGSLVVYRVENTSKKPLTSVAWTTAFTLNNQIIYTTNVVLDLNKQPIPAGSATDVRTLDLFKNMSEQSKAIIQDPTKQLGVIIVAREVSFADGSRVIVSE
ncbi:hypothetical protein C8D76_1264 [Pasteurella langaaensis DSM 22999]|uniref:Lipoprotein n=1 Tax=Alitibacter langaaensis DSM 22999 TaxID=1122935 RepID=A0A2U0SK00_9PAST|nr:hypothetical protein [Pasteurella langaaensis]PVX31667.1 hypothetical protein C8D76_1264 [Pasteurella langaaensis DSM 22999]